MRVPEPLFALAFKINKLGKSTTVVNYTWDGSEFSRSQNKHQHELSRECCQLSFASRLCRIRAFSQHPHRISRRIETRRPMTLTSKRTKSRWKGISRTFPPPPRADVALLVDSTLFSRDINVPCIHQLSAFKGIPSKAQSWNFLWRINEIQSLMAARGVSKAD